MYITYFDEVKYDPPDQTSYWYGGVGIDISNIPILEDQLNGLSREFFGTPEPTEKTEFHASWISGAKGHFKGMKAEKRYSLLKKLAQIVAQRNLIKRVYSRLMPEKLVSYKGSHDELAFMFFLERVDMLYSQEKTKGLVIGDFDSNLKVSESVQSLFWYRQNFTNFEFGRKIENILDTVHFARSHHSRLLQLADCYLWFRQLWAQPTPKYHRKKDLVEYLKTIDAIFPDRYKEWPL